MNDRISPDAIVTVQLSRELLQQLTLDWSASVQIMIRETGGGAATHEMICRKPAPAALIPSGHRLSGGGDSLSSAHERERSWMSKVADNWREDHP